MDTNTLDTYTCITHTPTGTNVHQPLMINDDGIFLSFLYLTLAMALIYSIASFYSLFSFLLPAFASLTTQPVCKCVCVCMCVCVCVCVCMVYESSPLSIAMLPAILFSPLL
jgi:hypothetical protein